ncbi:MAG: c-type cytochrome [Sutterellaceae bacterium]|nr:cytochrome c4 [Burkholderiaceae bacterium]MCX7901457.1 cytochrome c4 [Burkholderiaceae bacterium]MDW8430498.1 c-type cytochrome [Sutterellaceae bacterium]
MNHVPWLSAVALGGTLLTAVAASDTPQLERGRAIAASSCFLCHGLQGETASPLYPRLAGQNARYLEKQLRDFREGRRTGGGMEAQAAKLSDTDIEAVAAYFSRQRSEPFAPSDPKLVEWGRILFETGKLAAGVPGCASCHGTDARGAEALPRLAGQQPQYVIEQLKNFRRPWRRSGSEAMHDIAGKLSDAEITALAEYLGQLP